MKYLSPGDLSGTTGHWGGIGSDAGNPMGHDTAKENTNYLSGNWDDISRVQEKLCVSGSSKGNFNHRT